MNKKIDITGVVLTTDRLVNSLDADSYQQYLRYHFYICEKHEFMGMSNHLLFIGQAK